MKLIKPKALKPGDTLGVVCCSSPLAHEAVVQRGYAYLKEKGFRLVEAPNLRKTVGHAAGSIQERVKAFHNFLKDPAIDGILAYWGGYQSHQMLEYLDFDLIRRKPKLFVGYSDNTALQVGIFSKTGLVTFSGPCGISYAKPTVPDFTWEHFRLVAMDPAVPLKIGVSSRYSDNPWYDEKDGQMRWVPNAGWKVFRRGRAEGPLMGGNMGTMLLLSGTDYWPKLKGKILFVEEDEAESPKTVDRMFTQLRQIGVFDQIAGLIVGRFSSMNKFSATDTLEMILEESLRGYKFPVITDVDYGHTDPLVTFPLGIRCRVDADRKEITLLEAAVK